MVVAEVEMAIHQKYAVAFNHTIIGILSWNSMQA